MVVDNRLIELRKNPHTDDCAMQNKLNAPIVTRQWHQNVDSVVCIRTNLHLLHGKLYSRLVYFDAAMVECVLSVSP
jgi:hypothetical protein